MNWILYVCFLLPIAIIGLVISNSDMKGKYKVWLYYLAIILTAIYMEIDKAITTQEFNNKNHRFDTEIKQEVVNGITIKSDTIYIIEYFKPDKK